MASGDLQILTPELYGSHNFRVEDRTTSTANATVKAGEILNMGAGGSGTTAAAGNFVFQCVDPGSDGIGIEATDLLQGIAKEESNETSANVGRVVAYILGLGVRIRGTATTPSNMNTVAELNGLELDNITMDGITTRGGDTDTTPYTIDENDTSDPNVHAFQILTGDIIAGTLECRVVGATSFMGAGI